MDGHLPNRHVIFQTPIGRFIVPKIEVRNRRIQHHILPLDASDFANAESMHVQQVEHGIAVIDLVKVPVPERMMGAGAFEILARFIPRIGCQNAALHGPVPDAAQCANALAQGAIREMALAGELAIGIAPDQLMVDVLDVEIRNRHDGFAPTFEGGRGDQRLDRACLVGKISDGVRHGKRVHID
mgnify:FL=1